MILDKIIVKAPAKINLFLRILNRRKDGYYNIRSGITFINLFDEIKIKKSNLTSIRYSGIFKPKTKIYKDCIIKRVLEFLNLYEKVNLEISIKKNIPVQGGLGSASTNAAALIRGLEKLNLISLKDNYNYSSLGSDIPVCLYGKNSLIQGIGDNISAQTFPKYYFLIVKPSINLSTSMMYKKINKYLINKKRINEVVFKNTINDDDRGNDFEKIAILESNEINNLLNFLSRSEQLIFSRMSGSGSCCFAAFKKKEFATKAQKILKNDFPYLWSFVGNSIINGNFILS